ncbi:MAG: hypothetical protein IJ370_08980 [Oscillospiraceae bacterium]|nr:hypothetical protein [Oscillospiraceae bacterium]
MRTATSKKQTAKEKEAAKKRTTIIAGASVLAFALIGVITVISLIVGFVASLFDDSQQRLKFEQFIAPVVMVDPVAFSEVSKADEHTILMSSMWNLLINIGDGAAYPEDEFGMMLIPSSDLDVSAASLFGSEVALSHQTFGNTSITFEYDEETASYVVPPMGYTVQYQPRVDKISRRGKKYTLTVAYITSTTVLGNTQENADPDKYMYYVLEKTGKDKYVVTAIMDSETEKENVSSSLQNTSSGISQTETTSSGISKTETSSEATSSAAQTSSKK